MRTAYWLPGAQRSPARHGNAPPKINSLTYNSRRQCSDDVALRTRRSSHASSIPKMGKNASVRGLWIAANRLTSPTRITFPMDKNRNYLLTVLPQIELSFLVLLKKSNKKKTLIRQQWTDSGESTTWPLNFRINNSNLFTRLTEDTGKENFILSSKIRNPESPLNPEWLASTTKPLKLI